MGGFLRATPVLEKALEGLTPADLDQQPKPDCNSMGWLTWHMTRTQDRAISDMTGQEQIWVKDRWYEKFDRPGDPMETGLGHSTEQVSAFKAPEVAVLMAYYNAVLECTSAFFDGLTEEYLDRKMEHPIFPTVGARLIAMQGTNIIHHIGQIAYLRGLLKGKGWWKT